nr:unnamed protein product [Callosobruchus analis]
MIFNNAYEGKTYMQTFKILNAGKYPALVRIFSPSSKAFEMKPLPRGRYIAAGMSITRTIKYRYVRATAVPQACIAMYINDKLLNYEIEVFMSHSLVAMSPTSLNFGNIDVGNASEQMTVQLKNLGHKTTTFMTDLGKTDLEIIIDPRRGRIHPSETVEIKVEILGTTVGSFHKEFWIKTEPPQRLRISGTFIEPQLVIEHPLIDYDLTLIHFPRTYYGASNTRTIVINNKSSRPTMFCMVAEENMGTITMNAANAKDPNMRNFVINPIEGRLYANFKCIISAKFAPKRIEKFTRKQCIVMLQLLRVTFREGVIESKDGEVKTFTTSGEDEVFSIAPQVSYQRTEIVFTHSKLRVCLYGEIEKASVTLLPDAFSGDDLNVSVIHNFTFTIRNNSRYLPVTFKYNKVSCIETFPKEYTLKPSGSVDVLLQLRPTKIGKVQTNVVFDLTYHGEDRVVYNVGKARFAVTYEVHQEKAEKEAAGLLPKFNMGITPMITNEVGFLVDDIKFSSNVNQMPIQAIVDRNQNNFRKDNEAYVAFPNDMPQSLRPWRDKTPIKTIFAGLPRATELGTRVTKNYFKNTRRQQVEVLKRTSSDYSITGPNPMKDILRTSDCQQYTTFKQKEIYFIPLRPEKLMAITISPMYIEVGKIAPYTSMSDCFTIENNNNFPINVRIRALNNSVVIKGKENLIIGTNDKREIYFDCFSHGLGRYYVPVYILINNCHIFDATVFAEVVTKTVKCYEKEVFIDPTTNTVYFEIYNPVNCGITYSAEIQETCFKIVPASGIIAPRSGMTLRLTYIPEFDPPLNTELYLCSESGAKQIIKVKFQAGPAKVPVNFNTDVVNFENIPLNVPVYQDILLSNNSDTSVAVIVDNPRPMEGIEVSPDQGILMAKCDEIIKIRVHFKTPITFRCKLKIRVHSSKFEILITGKVSLPFVSFKPNFIQFPKIPAGAFQRRKFQITNTSEAVANVKFDLRSFSELSITYTDGQACTESISLEPNLFVDLWLEFRPIEPVVYTTYIPYILNDMVGPPRMNIAKSLDPISYFSMDQTKEQRKSIVYEGVTCDKTLDFLRVGCTAGRPWLQISPLHIDFVEQNTSSSQFKCFNVINVSNVEQRFGFLNDESNEQKPFKIFDEDELIVKRYYHKDLQPNEELELKVKFEPQEFGKYNEDIPLFIESFFENNCPFNYLHLSGLCPHPSITSDTYILFFETIPPHDKRSKTLTIQLFTHQPNCVLEVENEIESTEVTWDESDFQKSQLSRNIDVTVTFQPTAECNINSAVIFKCSCDTTFKLNIMAQADNSLLVTYDSLIRSTVKEDLGSTFPFFPDNEKHPFLHSEMMTILHIVEKWLFSQGYFYNHYYKIPHTIRRYSFEKKKQKKANFRDKGDGDGVRKFLPLQRLLVNLLDATVTKYLTAEVSPSDDDLEGTIHDYRVYKNILGFLLQQGIYVQQCCPEFLLTYTRYTVYHNKLVDSDRDYEIPMYTEEEFERISTLCWMDLILKIYKVLVFDRIFTEPRCEVDIYHEEFVGYCTSHEEHYSDRNPNEAKLFMWLNFHFEKQIKTLYPKEHITRPPVTSFTQDDFRDGLMLATLVLAYCPYLADQFKYLYVKDANDGQLFHNACLICEAWKKLKLSIEVDTYHIFQPRPTEMIMLLTYLYCVLPNFYPKETITISALIAESAVYSLRLTNLGDAPIAYTPLLFLNDLEEFEIDGKVVVIPPRQKKHLKLVYRAKHMLKGRAILVLSGETIGYKFATSKAFELIGMPNIYNFTQEFSIKLDMFRHSDHNLVINSPYEKAYDARTYLHVDDDDSRFPENLDDFIAMHEVQRRKVPRQFQFSSLVLFDETGQGVLDLQLCYLIYGAIVYYIFFVNESVGDFCVKITITANLCKADCETINIPIYKTFNPSAKCKCRKNTFNENCPLVVMAQVPCRNHILLEGIKEMFRMIGDEDEQAFWEEHLVFPKGFIVLRRYLQNTFEPKLVPFMDILQQSIVYTIQPPKKRFYCENLKIKDVTSEDPVELPIHWNCDSFPSEELVSLVADHGHEVRQYKLMFKAK